MPDFRLAAQLRTGVIRRIIFVELRDLFAPPPSPPSRCPIYLYLVSGGVAGSICVAAGSINLFN